jgi:DNA-binding CsgD family transcriptional regulator
MSKSRRLTLAEITEVFRVVQEAIDLGNNPVLWRERMLERMNKLTHSMSGVSFVIPTEFNSKNLAPPVFVYVDVNRNKVSALKFFKNFDLAADPMNAGIEKLRHRPVTLTRRQLVDDETWYNSHSYKTRRAPAGMDDSIHAHDPLPQFGVSAILGFTRAVGEKPYDLHDARMVDLLRSELRHRWLSSLAANSAKVPLSTRHQQLLVLLKGSKSEKQIAHYLGLSPHTIHNYIKELYRRLKVGSRAELLQLSLDDKSTKAVLPRIGYGDA